MADIFISYARSTAKQAQGAAVAFRELGYSVWLDADLAVHRAFTHAIEEQLTAAKAALVIWSADAARSEWVLSEANRAREESKLVQIAIEEIRLPMPFDQIQCADLTGWTGEGEHANWSKVLASVAELVGGTPSPAVEAAQDARLPLPSRPSIGVMPFANQSNDPEQDYFADGMMEEIVAALSRFKSIFVIASGSTLSFKGKAITPQEVGRRLGVRYVLEGSVRKAANRVRIAVKLVDARDGSQIWAERYEDTFEDVFALQDRVALSVAGVIEPTVLRAETQRASARTQNMSAYELFLRARASGGSFTKAGLLEALDLLSQAMTLDPTFARAVAFAGWCESELWQSGLLRTDEHRSRAIELAHRALQLADDDPEVLTQVALVLGNQLVEDLDSAIVLVDRALALNPGMAAAWAASGWQRLAAGEPDLAAEHFQAMQRLDPLAQRSTYLLGMGAARLTQGRFAEAAALLREGRHLKPDSPNECIFLAACYGNLGQVEAGREAIARWETLTGTSIHNPVNWFATNRPMMAALALAEGRAMPDG